MPPSGGARKWVSARSRNAGGERGSPHGDLVAEGERLDPVVGEHVDVPAATRCAATPSPADRGRGCPGDQHGHARPRPEGRAGTRRCPRSRVVLVGVSGDADRIDARSRPSEARASEHRAARLGGGRRRAAFGASKDAVEMDVGNVEELHGAKNCMWRVGRTACAEQRRPRRALGGRNRHSSTHTRDGRRRYRRRHETSLPVLAVVVVLVVTVVWHRLQIDPLRSRAAPSRAWSTATPLRVLRRADRGRSPDRGRHARDGRPQPAGWLLRPSGLGVHEALADRPAVTLVYDRETHDKYGRFLAYVYVTAHGRCRWSGDCCGWATPHALDSAQHRPRGGVLGAREGGRGAGRGLWSACQ